VRGGYATCGGVNATRGVDDIPSAVDDIHGYAVVRSGDMQKNKTAEQYSMLSGFFCFIF
jgi:hypothetical protein